MAVVQERYFMASPDGNMVPIPEELFIAISDFFLNKYAGEITIGCRNGGIASVEGRRRYKGGNIPPKNGTPE